MTSSGPSPALAIVETLRKYGPVPADFVAKLLNYQVRDIQDYLDRLEQAGVIERQGNLLRLTGR